MSSTHHSLPDYIKSKHIQIQNYLKDRLFVFACLCSKCMSRDSVRIATWPAEFPHRHTLPLPVPHMSGSAICRPLKVKGHIQTPKVNQAANNKLASFDKQMCGPPLLLHLWDIINRSYWLSVTKKGVWSFILRDGFSYRCQAKVGEFLGQLEETFLRFQKERNWTTHIVGFDQCSSKIKTVIM